MKTRFIISLVFLFFANVAFADKLKTYEVSITNITKGQAFTPQLVALHKGSVKLFSLGEAASDSLEELAEGGNTAPLMADLKSMPETVSDVFTNEVLLLPGMTTRFEIRAHPRHHFLSFIAMMLPTNDTFVAISRMKLPHRKMVSKSARAYDAGTEDNDQSCTHIPGPFCGGEGFSATEGEGYVYLSNGIHTLGNLSPELHDWNNPVAIVKITRIDKD